MNKKVLKIVSIVLMIMLIVSIGITSFATTPNGITAENVETSNMDNIGKKLVGWLQGLGVILSVVVLIVIGIKYMMGSAEEKAEYKKTLMPYVIGAILIFAASAFAQAIYDFVAGF